MYPTVLFLNFFLNFLLTVCFQGKSSNWIFGKSEACGLERVSFSKFFPPILKINRKREKSPFFRRRKARFLVFSVPGFLGTGISISTGTRDLTGIRRGTLAGR